MPAGRPTVYEDRFCEMAYVACKEGGFTDVKLGKLFGVSKATINTWKRQHPGFFDSIKKGKDEYDTEIVEKNLLKRANGYRYVETTKEPDSKDAEKMVVTKRVSKSVAPDTTAQIFWLKNRNPARWRDKQEIDINPAIPVPDISDDIPEDEAAEVYRNVMG